MEITKDFHEGTKTVLTLKSTTDPNSGLHFNLDWEPPLSSYPDPDTMPLSHKLMAAIFATSLLPAIEAGEKGETPTVN